MQNPSPLRSGPAGVPASPVRVGPGDSPAVARLKQACLRSRGALSIGLEPCPDYLPPGFSADLNGYERFLMLVAESTADSAAAFKFNLAFFEALGPDGWALLHRVRRRLPAGPIVIADAKRGDIGSSARPYAAALFDSLDADAATVNPLMGSDAVEPFLDYEDRITFLLTLTSNPGSSDFLLRGGLFRSIAKKATEWNTHGNCGLVVGATHPEQAEEVRSIAGGMPLLIPGVGAQGGALEETARSARWTDDWPSILIHVTRGLLPSSEEADRPGDALRRRAEEWRERINIALHPS